MKRFIRCLSAMLVLITLLGTVAYAQEVSTRASSYFVSWDSSLAKISSNQFEIWFDVVSAGAMDKLGVSSIEVERSSNGTSWTVVKTYDPEDYSTMIEENTSCVYNCVTYTGSRGYFYRAYVTFYAKNSRGTGEMYDYSEVLYLPTS